MKNKYTLFTLFLFSLFVSAQASVVTTCSSTVTIPDANFKAELLANTAINTIDDGEISCVEAAAYTGGINVFGKSISDLTGIEAFTNITSLNCGGNSLTSIDVSANTALTSLFIGSNSLEVLDVSKNIALTGLFMPSNNVKELDISANTVLTELNVYDNNLIILNVANGNNTNFTSFFAGSNSSLRCIQIDASFTPAMGSIWDNKDAAASYTDNCSYDCSVDIPDANFKAELLANMGINTIDDGRISCAEAEAYTGVINVFGKSISDLTGIEAFTNITSLNCGGNSLTSIDVSANTALTSLFIGSNSLEVLDVSKNIALTGLFMASNNVKELDISANTVLTQLNVHGNELIILNVANGNNENFTSFFVDTNSNLTCIQIDAGFTPAMGSIWDNKDAVASYSDNCNYCFVDIPDANFKAELLANTLINTIDDGEISCAEAEACTGTIDVSNKSISDLTGIEAFTSITSLNCASNDLSSIDVSKNISLETLILYHNNIKELDVSANTSLTELDAGLNDITELDVSANTALIKLTVESSNIEELDVSANTALTQLNATSNNLKILNVANGNNTNFTSFSAMDNNNLTCIQIDAGFTPNISWSKAATASYSNNCGFTLTTVASNGVVSANVAPADGNYDYGTNVVLTAKANEGYEFVGWSGSVIGTNNPLVVTMNADKILTAKFSLIQRNLTTTALNGTISRDVTPVNGTYNNDTVVELTAEANEGYEFVGWSGNATGTSNPLTITMDVDKTIEANFSLFQTSLTTTALNGTISRDVAPTNGTYDSGTIVELTAEANAGYEFVGWSGNATGTSNPLSITMDADKMIEALFSAVLGIDDVFAAKVSVYPNPVTQMLNIDLATGESLKKVQVFTLLGDKVLEVTTTPVDFTDIAFGVYILKIEDTKGNIATRKIIKK